MSFVGGSFTHDIFVSYAHGKDLTQAYSDSRRNPLYEWSHIFVDKLRSQLDMILTSSARTEEEAPDVWMDPKLSMTGSLEGNLEKEVKCSALLLTLVSPYYLRSSWCCEEARLFSEAAGEFAPVSRQDRTFVVSIGPTDRDSWPQALRDDNQKPFLGMEFFGRVGVEDWGAAWLSGTKCGFGQGILDRNSAPGKRGRHSASADEIFAAEQSAQHEWSDRSRVRRSEAASRLLLRQPDPPAERGAKGAVSTRNAGASGSGRRYR
jgi:hypothetical protein